MSNRLEKAFAAVNDRNEKAFVPYIMAGDGGLESLKEKLLFLEKCGATAVELGIPFSDPVADGPTIQRAGLRALKKGTTLQGVLEALETIRDEVSIPYLIMTYMNPILAYGLDSFIESATRAGIDGCIIPDLPVEEEDLIAPKLEEAGIELIRLVTLTSPPERIKEISEKGNGFLYAVTVTGITGARSGFQTEIGAYLQKVKEASNKAVLAGFGISTPDHVREFSQYCDGVIVGSRIIDLFEADDLKSIEQLIRAARTVGTA
ncbi:MULTISPECIES: tryptophan synthase subunit alpha [Bacillus]|uniref:tryptophan synthase subunit alpha n=1 Tax=Bacillus TaxID=1386 RepID=UPI000C759E41|nr:MULTISPECIES: tryptophan synthase subunit alpha [Bacillus]PLR83384.1 tryptophan synthase subunit alpha [Bacillus sp. V33-4]RSK51743.1 tryptophan synthase subunit alpha [Bacillus canaveralius]